MTPGPKDAARDGDARVLLVPREPVTPRGQKVQGLLCPAAASPATHVSTEHETCNHMTEAQNFTLYIILTHLI